MILCLFGYWQKSSNFNENLTSGAYSRMTGCFPSRVIGLNFAAFHAKMRHRKINSDAWLRLAPGARSTRTGVGHEHADIEQTSQQRQA
jgi:hypothetical protein